MATTTVARTGASMALLALAAVTWTACGSENEGDRAGQGEPTYLRGMLTTCVMDRAGELDVSRSADMHPTMDTMREAGARAASDGAAITVDYPLEGSLFPPDFTPPTFLWHDESQRADVWLLEIHFEDGGENALTVLQPQESPPERAIDPEARGETNELYVPTEYQGSARSWTPRTPVWEAIKRRSTGRPARITFTGFAVHEPDRPLSRGVVTIETSKDPVGAPLFYRDVPLMPGRGERGVIQPLSTNALPLIGWRVRDVSLPESRLVLQGMPSCGNCHSFSLDGTTFGMDVDGPQGDKGTYAIAHVTPDMEIDYEDVITWNSFKEKPKGHKTIGFLSRVSPTGRYVVTTLNESLYVANFLDHKYLQVFFPTRGILAWYDTETEEMKALPGADDTDFVQCDPAWTPDGGSLVFARAPAKDPYVEGRPLAAYPNDPNETEIQYDLYRIPFADGKGGAPVRIEGASENGMSNTFPKVSPDGKWIVFTKCRNGQLMRPDGRLWIVPLAGGEAREMRCNTDNMNSWHSWSPNSRWLVFSSKINTPYTQMFLTHIDEEGNDTPAILVPNSTAANRAVNLPEFVNAPYDSIGTIDVPAVEHHRYFWQGVDLIREARFAEAIPVLEKAIQAEPTFSRAHVNLGLAYAEQGNFADAIPHYRRALEISPDDVFAHNNLGLAYAAMGRPDLAIQHYRRALDRDPTLLHARRNLAFVLAQQGALESALTEMTTVVDADPEDTEGLAALSRLLVQAGRNAEAAERLEALVALDPTDVQALSTLAWLLATAPDDDARDGERAVRFAKKAVELSRGERPEPYDALAAAYAETGRFQEALGASGRALRLLEGRGGKLAKDIQARAELYRRGRPYRTPVVPR